nr:hypothetical protein [uncultured Campylobacter sp.]
MRSLFSGEICAAADKFKFAFERSFEILFSHVLILSVEFPANSAAKILNDKISLFRTSTQSASRGLVKTLRSKISLSRILSNEALLRGILLGRNPLLGASSRKISYPWIYERKIPARKISFFEILQALFYRESTAPRSLGALNFASQNPLVALTNVASENSCTMQAVKFIKFTGSVSGSETTPSFTPTVTTDRTQTASFTAANFIAIKAVKASSIAIKAIITKVANALNLASSRVFARLKNGSDLKEVSRAH